MTNRKIPAGCLALGLALLAGGCGDGTEDAGTTEPNTASTAAPGGAATTARVGVVSSAAKPVVTIPEGPPPTQLQVKDVTVGTGPEAVAGKTASVHYVGVAYSTKQEFDASWNRGQPFSFPLGAGRVIDGWDQGVVGMKVGGRRELVIPPHLGYGAQGQGPIKGGETLIFVVDLLGVS